MKKIVISEDSINHIAKLVNEEHNELLLPKFIFKRVKEHNTSLGDNDAFPKNEYYPFDYKILKTRFKEVTNEIHTVSDIESLDADYLTSLLMKYIRKCRELERPIRDNLVKVCENVVNKLFSVPQETVILKCELTDKLKPNHEFRVIPEDEEDNSSFSFNDLNEIEAASRAIKKRRLINALIQGACYTYSSDVELWGAEISQLNEELPYLYENIRKINDYLLFTKQENITDKHHMQGAYVEVELGRGDDKTIIMSQGLLFPYLLNETLRGFFELFASHGLPKDTQKAKYIINKADFLVAEPWDLRLGVGLWRKVSSKIQTSGSLPFFFTDLSELKIDEFNEVLKEVFANTRKGEDYLEQLSSSAEHAFDMQDFDYMVKQKNSEVSVISDEYIPSDEIDDLDYMIEEGNDEENNDHYYDLIVNSTPNDMDIDLECVLEDGNKALYNAVVSINGEELPLYVVDLKCEKIVKNGETLYVPHIEIMPRYRNIGLGFKIYKTFIECVGNIYRSEINTYNHFEMPRIYDKLNSEPHINVEDEYDDNGEVIGRIARLGESKHTSNDVITESFFKDLKGEKLAKFLIGLLYAGTISLNVALDYVNSSDEVGEEEKPKIVQSIKQAVTNNTKNTVNEELPTWKLVDDKSIITVYNALPRQCNNDCSHTASMFTLDLNNVGSHKICAVERTFMETLGIEYGDVIKIEGTYKGLQDGVYQVQDTMNKRFAGQHKIDILVPNNIKIGGTAKNQYAKVYVLNDKSNTDDIKMKYNMSPEFKK